MTKLRMDLVPAEAEAMVAAAFEDGSRIYRPWAWRNGSPWCEKQLSAALRHIRAWRSGEDVDPQSGVHHLAHAASRLMILLEFSKDPRYARFDDRKESTRGPTREP